MRKSVRLEEGVSEQVLMLGVISRTAELCQASEPDAAIDRELRELEALASAVAKNWPLDESVKRQIDLGSFAAKNISDWNPVLSDLLMNLDYSLRHDQTTPELIDKLWPSGPDSVPKRSSPSIAPIYPRARRA